jgi:hypothetical protein
MGTGQKVPATFGPIEFTLWDVRWARLCCPPVAIHF